MPIYEYRCEKCGHQLEAIQKMSDPALVTCPECSKDSLIKLISAAGFQLKGTGWYQTDFKNSGKKPDKVDKPAPVAEKPKDTTPTGTCGSGGCGACS
jgi:putative FmdB family regulatory protein